MPTITVDQIAASFRTAVDATVPRMVEGQAVNRWKYAEGETSPRAASRWYRFDWDGEGDTPDGFSGPLSKETDVTLSIVVDYGGVPKHRVKIVAVDDWHQLNDVLNRLKSANLGLRWVEKADWDPENDDPNQVRMRLQYLVQFMKARG